MDSNEESYIAETLLGAALVIGITYKVTRKPKCTSELRGHRFLVTGASSGIGLATVQELARRGASVTLTLRDISQAESLVDGLKNKYTGAIKALQLDLNDFESIRKCADCVNKSGGLTCLINNAGTMTP